MSRAEDRAAKKALEKFPILFGERMGYDKTNLQQERRNAYEKGYHQAEKDLELTWEDLATIEKLGDDFVKQNHTPMSDEEFYKEVLKRFRILKKRKGNNYGNNKKIHKTLHNYCRN